MELGNGLSCGFKLCKHCRQLSIQPRDFLRERVCLGFKRVLLFTQALIFTILSKDSLLTPNQL